MKLLDIDNQVAGGVDSIAKLGVTFTTIHAYPKAMRAAVSALRQAEGKAAGGPGLLAVTALTSMNDADLKDAGYAETPQRWSRGAPRGTRCGDGRHRLLAARSDERAESRREGPGDRDARHPPGRLRRRRPEAGR